MIKILVLLLTLVGISFQLDQPEFWNRAQLQISSGTSNVNLDFYYGWDKLSTYAYFRIKGNYKGWIALGFGDNPSKMDMIVLRLKQLRVEAEDRYSTNDQQIPELNGKLKDTFLIKGDRNAEGDWDAIFKRKATSIDPRKVKLDQSDRYFTLMLGEINDEEFTKIKKIQQVFKIKLTSEKICHATCKISMCTGPSEFECTDCDLFRVLFRNTCILRNPVMFSEIKWQQNDGSIDSTLYSLNFGFSDKQDIVYFRLIQKNKWKQWMGLMFNYTAKAISDFYVVYQTSTNQLVSDYFITPSDMRTTEDEILGDGDNDAFITDSSDNYITFARKVDTGSIYDLPFIINGTLNMTLFVGTKDFFESETQPFQKQQSFFQNDFNQKCNDDCSTCLFDFSQKNCDKCKDLLYLSTFGSVTSCIPATSLSFNSLPFTPSINQLTKQLLNKDGKQIKYDIITNTDPSNPYLYISFDINMKTTKQQSNPISIQIPISNTDINYQALSLTIGTKMIFLYCTSDGKVKSIPFNQDPLTKILLKVDQPIGVFDDSQCTVDGRLTAKVAVQKNTFIVDGTLYQVTLNLHVSQYDYKSLVLYQSSSAGLKLNTITCTNPNCKQCSASDLTVCTECQSSSLKLPGCCPPNQIYIDSCLTSVPTYWNQINVNGDNSIVSYAVQDQIIFFKYSIKDPNNQGGSFGCGFNSNAVNTDMIIFNFADKTVKDFYSYGHVLPELDIEQNIVDQKGWEAVFARKIMVDEVLNTQDKSLVNYNGPLICYLGQTGDLQPSKREQYLVQNVQFLQKVCHPTCASCACNSAITNSCQMVCQCQPNFQLSLQPNAPKDQCFPTFQTSCSITNCSKCTLDNCIECATDYFLFQNKCFSIIPALYNPNENIIKFNDIGFSLLYGFDSTQEHIYLNIQGTNQGYVALGLGKHSQIMDIIMLQDSIQHIPIVSDMFSQGTIFCKEDDKNDITIVNGGMNGKTGFWNITVFRSIVSTDKTQDMDIDLVNTNLISIALGQDQQITYHKSTQLIESSFQFVQTKGGQINYKNTYIPERAEFYNKLNITKLNITLYYGFDKKSEFIYFKVEGALQKNWFGMGFGNSMTSTDMIIVKNTKSDKTNKQIFVVEDRFSDGQKMPRLDISVDVIMTKSTALDSIQSNSNSTVEFVRRLATKDRYSEDFNFQYNTDLKQTGPIDLIFALGKDSDFTQQGHQMHQLIRDVSFSNVLDCSHCNNSKCKGPDITDCLDQTDTSVTIFSLIGIQFSILSIVFSLFI